ncbi:MAG: hypothetical protein LBF08_07775 [Dysgonamonadaceae bacterium]|jgi:hypothetical protein|nr:hypothetical protein [Dysgonamonadaceae bacterium]
MQKTKFLIPCALLILSAFLSCNNDFEDYSNNPADRLAFSTDTLAFDTVLTTVNSPVKAFMVYNPNKKPLLITSIRLAAGANSNFKINVDGFAGSDFTNIEIRGNDSLYVLVDVKPDETEQPEPTLIEDYIVFTTHQSEQQIVLQAYGQDVYKHRDFILDKDTVLSGGKPFLIYDSLVVGKGVIAEIPEGVTFYMGNNAQVIVYGTLKIRGTVEKPVVFRGSRTDKMLIYPYDLIPGQWNGFRFDSASYDNEFEHVHIRNGKYGMDFDASDPVEKKITLKNVVLTNVSGVLLRAINCNITAENCEISNAKDPLLALCGGRYQFIHCTIANYYPRVDAEAGWGTGDSQTVYLTDEVEGIDGEPAAHYPVLGFEVSNSIIAGDKPTSEINIDLKEEPAERFNFRNCVFTNKTPEKNYIVYAGCITEEAADSLFKKSNYENERHEFWPIYDFRLRETSPARNVAALEIAQQIPLDIKGVNRLEDEFPDIGAYEFVVESEDDF